MGQISLTFGRIWRSTHASTLAFNRSARFTSNRDIYSVNEKPDALHVQVILMMFLVHSLAYPITCQVQMETFKAAPGDQSPSNLSYNNYDVEGRVTRPDETDISSDIEASPVEYKRPGGLE